MSRVRRGHSSKVGSRGSCCTGYRLCCPESVWGQWGCGLVSPSPLVREHLTIVLCSLPPPLHGTESGAGSGILRKWVCPLSFHLSLFQKANYSYFRFYFKAQSLACLMPNTSMHYVTSITHRALELLTQLSKRSHAPSAVGPALQQLLNSDLCAKWWTHCHLQSSDIITNMEFFDPGPVRTSLHHHDIIENSHIPLQALAGAQAYSSLSSLLSHPPHMNRPILTANLLLPEVTPTSVETTPTPAVTEQMSPSHQRSKSRSKG